MVSFLMVPSSRLALGFLLGDGLGEPEDFVEKCRRAFLVGGVVGRAVVLETVMHAGNGQAFRDGHRAHADDDQPQLREAVDAAKAARGHRHDADRFALVFRQQIIQRVLEHAGIAVVVFRRDDDERIRAANLVAEFPQARRRVVAPVQSFLHDGEIIFEQVEQFRGHARALLQPRQHEARDLDALPVPARAAGDDGDVIHKLKSPCSIAINSRRGDGSLQVRFAILNPKRIGLNPSPHLAFRGTRNVD